MARGRLVNLLSLEIKCFNQGGFIYTGPYCTNGQNLSISM